MAFRERGQHEGVRIAQPLGKQLMLHHSGEFCAHPRGAGLGFQPAAERAGADHHQQARRAPPERGRRLDERGEVLLLGEASYVQDAAAPARAAVPRGEPLQIHPVGDEMDTLRRCDGGQAGYRAGQQTKKLRLLRRHPVHTEPRDRREAGGEISIKKCDRRD